MRSPLTLVALLLGGMTAASEPFVAPAPWPEPFACCEPACAPFAVRANYLYMQRSRPEDAPLVVVDTVGALNASAIHFDFESGWELSGFWNLAPGLGLEARYLQPGEFSGYADYYEVQEEGEFEAEVDYRSRLLSAELNARAAPHDWVTVLIGFRYVRLTEALELLAIYEGGDETTIESADVRTRNDLFGGQLGAEVWLWTCGPLHGTVGLKCGLYYNDASRTVDVEAPEEGGIEGEDSRSDHDSFAFVGEAAVAATYQINDFVAVRAGWQFIWLDNVVVASDQFNEPDPPGVSTVGAGADHTTTFFHGGFAGVEVAW